MKRDREFDELLRQKISETLEEPIDESIDADDLMFDLGMRYFRMVAAEKKKSEGKKRDPLVFLCQEPSLCPVPLSCLHLEAL